MNESSLPHAIELGPSRCRILLSDPRWCCGYTAILLLALGCLSSIVVAVIFEGILPNIAYGLTPVLVLSALYASSAPSAKLTRLLIQRLEQVFPGSTAWKTEVMDGRTLPRLAAEPAFHMVPSAFRRRAYYIILEGRLVFWARIGRQLVRFAVLPPGNYRMVIGRGTALEVSFSSPSGVVGFVQFIPSRGRLRSWASDREAGFAELRQWCSQRQADGLGKT